MKLSIITACYNSGATLCDALASVAAQDYADLEHIVVDGGSTDNTPAIVESHGRRVSKFIREPDKGIYDALNKGIKAAVGEIIGIMHSDDIYADSTVLSKVAEFMSVRGVDSCYGDIVYIDRARPDKIVRYWRAGEYRRELFKCGWMPPHTAFFIRKSVHDKYGLYSLDFPLASDYELMLRMLYRYGVSTAYLPEVLVKMRTGGASRAGLVNTARMLRENYRAWKANGFAPSLATFLLKPISKLSQYSSRP